MSFFLIKLSSFSSVNVFFIEWILAGLTKGSSSDTVDTDTVYCIPDTVSNTSESEFNNVR